MTEKRATELREKLITKRADCIRQAWKEAAGQWQNANRSIDAISKHADVMQALFDAYCRTDAKLAKNYQAVRAKCILDYTLCDYPFEYYNLMMISPSDRKSITEIPSIAAEMDEKFKKEKPKILVDETTLKLFIDIIPDFFDGLTLIDEDDVHKGISLDADECLRRF
jgi:hypothetical protein